MSILFKRIGELLGQISAAPPPGGSLTITIDRTEAYVYEEVWISIGGETQYVQISIYVDGTMLEKRRVIAPSIFMYMPTRVGTYRFIAYGEKTGETAEARLSVYQAPTPTPPTMFTLNIIAREGGTTNPAPGTYQYVAGTSISIAAYPSSGYEFDYWLVNGEKRTVNPITITLNTNTTVEAYFRRSAIAPPPEEKVTLTIVSREGGTTSPAPGSYSYTKNSTVSITAIPSSGYVFDHWSVDGGISYSNPITLTLDANKRIEAFFAPSLVTTPTPAPPPPTVEQPPPAPTPTPTEIVVSTPTGTEAPAPESSTGLKLYIRIASGAGTVDPEPGAHYYTMGTEVVVSAKPDSGYSFDYFLIDGKEPFFYPNMKILMNADHVVEVYFSPGIRKSRTILSKLLYRIRRVFK